MNQCLYCKQETTNPKFCNKSHAARYNNARTPKRKLEGCCCDCGISITRQKKRCKSCHSVWVDQRSITKWDVETLESMRGQGNANFGGRYPYVRALARKKYLSSGLPLKCKQCGYDYHVDVCHIVDLKAFPQSATVAEVNDLSNLVALCKNHHWEFDTGLLTLSN